MSGRRAAWVVPILAVALTATLALSGCSRLADTGAEGSSPVLATPAGSTPATPAAPDAATLDSISSDLGAADTANTEAGSNASAGDQAAAQNDDG